MGDQVERKLTTILATDIAGYSRLMAADEEGTLSRLKSHRRELIDPKIKEHRGRIIKTTGDGMLVEFASVVDAVRCAVDVQRGMEARNEDVAPNKRIEFRVGINIGDVIVDGEDIYGDGVNIAARLENIAEPGGIRVSATVRDHVLDKLGFAFDDLGEQNVKNIPRPVRVYRVQLNDGEAPRSVAVPVSLKSRRSRKPLVWSAVAAVLAILVAGGGWFGWRTLGLGNPPPPAHLSIVVLPFANLSNDPKQDYFADGITENLTTDFSRIRNSFVIARNTAFTYKGKNVDAKEIGKELGVRYVLEGSVQRDGNRVRVNAQLIDAESGSHLWADRFEEDLSDLFKLQDDVVARLANSLRVELITAESHNAEKRNPDAIDLTMRGLVLFWALPNKDNDTRMHTYFDEASKLDPNDDNAFAGSAAVYVRDIAYGWTSPGINYERLIIDQSDRALAIDPNNPVAFYAKSLELANSGKTEEALTVADAAVAGNPNFAPLYFARAYVATAVHRYDQARSDVLQAMKLSPRDPQRGSWFGLLSDAELGLGHYVEAVSDAKKSIEMGGRIYRSYVDLAAAEALAGKIDDAKAAAAEARRLNPKLTVKWLIANASGMAGPNTIAGLRLAGLPEDEPPPPPKHLSIVVLPFTNLSGDPKQDYFADGITENLTTDLSRIRNSFVIARNTAFTYKGKNVDAKEIGKELGVRYVLEGSVQRDGNRVRVNAQLIDAESGTHLWADRFEEDLADLFKLQDDVVARLANALGYELVNAEAQKAAHAANPDAIDLTMQGWALLAGVGRDRTRYEQARDLFERALKVEPNNVDALVGAAFSGMVQEISGNSVPGEVAKAEDRIARAINIDPNNARAYDVKAWLLFYTGKEPQEAASAAKKAISLNSNFADAYAQLAADQSSYGEYDQALANNGKAIQLSPRDPELAHWHLTRGKILLLTQRYEEAISEERQAIEGGFRDWGSFSFLAAAYALAGKQTEAEAAITEARLINPKLTVKWIRDHIKNPAIVYEALRKAGLPEDEGPRLSIVVLPFTNLSGDAKQDYLADVLTDELTTYISRIPGSFVIARNTAFTYKGRPTDVKTIGKDLGVRYVLEGSVQPTDKRIRTNAQLIDTETGAHLWAEEFDNDKTDLLETQDEIVTRLARTLQLQLTEIEAARLTQTHPANSEAQELALRCDAMVSGSGSLYGGKDAEAGYALCEKALEVDPKNVVALAFLSIKFGSRVQEYMSVDRDADLARSEEFATRALAIDPNNAYAFVGRAFALIAQGRFEEARITAEHALALAPSLIEAYNLQTLIDLYTGNAEKVIESADKAMRLSPRDPLLFNFIALKGTAYFMRREDAKAIELFRRANALSPSPTPNYFYLAAAQALSGHVAEARETLKRYLAIPSVRTRSIAAWKTRTYSTNPAYLAMRERVYDGLRKAGMAEQ